jgi:hypothetical protein
MKKTPIHKSCFFATELKVDGILADEFHPHQFDVRKEFFYLV